MGRTVVALAVADLLPLVAASMGALTFGPNPGDALASQVKARPWPARVTPTGPWSARLEGSGPRFTMTAMAGSIPDALAEATFRLPERTAITSRPTNLTLPDGSVWHPKGAFRPEASGPVPFTSVRARGDVLDVGVASLQSVLAPAAGPVTAVGTFVGPDIVPTQQPRQKVDRGLTTRSGTEVVLALRGNFPEVRVPLAIPFG